MNKFTNNEEVQKYAEALKERLGVKVHPLVFKIDEHDTELVVGFMREPNRMVKMRVLDKSILSPMTAAEEMLQAILIKEESDPRIYSEDPEFDKLYIGAVMRASEIIKFSQQLYKKK